MSDVPPATVAPVPAASSLADGGDDPFTRLHKMSITAGLGSGDYVGISGLAIAAVLLGVASALVLFHSTVLLAVPLAGLTCAALAWVEVGRSNGTLTGRGLAVLGGVLSLGFGGYETVNSVSSGVAANRSRREVITLIHDFGQDVVAGRYPAAYDRCDARFHSYVPVRAFEGTWRSWQHSPYLGELTGIDWNNLLSFETDPVTGQGIAAGMVLLRYDHSTEPVRTDMFFQQGDDGRWMIGRIPQFFPPPDAKSPAPNPGSGQRPSGGQPGVYGPPKPTS